MEMTEEQYARIKDSLPVQRGNKSDELASTQRYPVCGRAGMQVARASETVWPVAHDLHPHESVGQEWRVRPRV